jgi:hypothetical protein
MGLPDVVQGPESSPASPGIIMGLLFTSESQRRIDAGVLETMTPVARHSTAHQTTGLPKRKEDK